MLDQRTGQISSCGKLFSDGETDMPDVQKKRRTLATPAAVPKKPGNTTRPNNNRGRIERHIRYEPQYGGNATHARSRQARLSLNGLRSVFPHEEIKHGRSVGERGRFGFVTEDNLQVGRERRGFRSADYVEEVDSISRVSSVSTLCE